MSQEGESKSTSIVKLEDTVKRISGASSRSSKNSKRRKTNEETAVIISVSKNSLEEVTNEKEDKLIVPPTLLEQVK